MVAAKPAAASSSQNAKAFAHISDNVRWHHEGLRGIDEFFITHTLHEASASKSSGSVCRDPLDSGKVEVQLNSIGLNYAQTAN